MTRAGDNFNHTPYDGGRHRVDCVWIGDGGDASTLGFCKDQGRNCSEKGQRKEMLGKGTKEG